MAMANGRRSSTALQELEDCQFRKDTTSNDVLFCYSNKVTAESVA